MLHKTKPQFEKLIAPVCGLFMKLNVTPNWITVLGLLLVIAAMVSFALRQFWLFFIFGVAGAILDGVDGKVARDTGKITRFGGFLDSSLDRIAEIIIAGGVLYCFIGSGLFTLASGVVVATITGALLTSYVRARGDAAGFDPKEGLLQRADRGAVFLSSIIIGLVLDRFCGNSQPHYFLFRAILLGSGIIALAAYFTVFQRIYFVWKNTKDQ